MDTLLTLPQFAEAAARAVEASGAQPDNRQAKAVPAARMVRYYTARGLLPRPGTRGRALVYGRRHLLHLVAIKRLQGQGMTLDEIAQRLAGIAECDLEDLAAVPDGAMPTNLGEVDPVDAKGMSRTAGRFWETAFVDATPFADDRETSTPKLTRVATRTKASRTSVAVQANSVVAKMVIEVRLSDSVRLLVEGDPGAMPNMKALRAAAGPLLELLTSAPVAHDKQAPAAPD